MYQDKSQNLGHLSPFLMAALRRLFKPLVRLLLRQQVAFPVLVELLKSLYVQVAETEFTLESKRQSDSRLHVLTGIHRRDIKRLRGIPEVAIKVPVNIAVGGQAVSRWCTDPEYLDAEGNPAPLPRLARKAGSPSFEALVSSISKDTRPRTLLDEWLRIEVVTLNEDHEVCLRREAFIPDKGLEEKLYYLGRNLHDHIATCEHNLGSDQAPFFERSVNYPELLAEDVEILRQKAAEMGMQTLTTLNEMALKLRENSAGQPGERERINVGIYFYKEPAENETGQQSSTPNEKG